MGNIATYLVIRKGNYFNVLLLHCFEKVSVQVVRSLHQQQQRVLYTPTEAIDRLNRTDPGRANL
jgi:hypothetical protein